MKKLKNMIALLLAALLIFSLAACGSSASTDSIDTGNTSEPTEAVSNTGDNSESTESSVPGDFPGEPPEGGPGGTPPDKRMETAARAVRRRSSRPETSSDIDYTASVEITSGDSQSGQTYASTTADGGAPVISTLTRSRSRIRPLRKTGTPTAADNATSMADCGRPCEGRFYDTITGGTITLTLTAQTAYSATAATAVRTELRRRYYGYCSGYEDCYNRRRLRRHMTKEAARNLCLWLDVTTKRQVLRGDPNDRGGGTALRGRRYLYSNGLGSPAIYSLRRSCCGQCDADLELSEGVCIEGLNLSLNDGLRPDGQQYQVQWQRTSWTAS